jgi:hypothetical protein
LRGWENLNKRFKLAAAFYNLSQLMRKLFGFGTPKQLAAAMERVGRPLFSLFTKIFAPLEVWMDAMTDVADGIGAECSKLFWTDEMFSQRENAIYSTGC